MSAMSDKCDKWDFSHPPRAGGEMSDLAKLVELFAGQDGGRHVVEVCVSDLREWHAEIERLRALVDGSTVLDAGHLEDEIKRLLDENGSLIAVCREFIDRWPTEEGIDNTIQRARAILLDHDLRNPEKRSVNRALEGK